MADVHGGRLPAAVEEELAALTVLRDFGRITADEFERQAVVVVCKAATVWDRHAPASRPVATAPTRPAAPAPAPVSAPNSAQSVVPGVANLWVAAQQPTREREPVAAAV